MHKHSPCHERFLVGMVLMVLHLTDDFTHLPREAWALPSSSQIPHGAVGSLTSSFSILRVASLDCSWWYRTSSSVWTGCWALTWHTCRNDSHRMRWPRAPTSAELGPAATSVPIRSCGNRPGKVTPPAQDHTARPGPQQGQPGARGRPLTALGCGLCLPSARWVTIDMILLSETNWQTSRQEAVSKSSQ